jgi:hypothetical protein
LVRFCVDYRIKPHVPPLEKIPANFVKFKPCDRTIQVGLLNVSLSFSNSKPIFYSVDY